MCVCGGFVGVWGAKRCVVRHVNVDRGLTEIRVCLGGGEGGRKEGRRKRGVLVCVSDGER